MFTRLFSSISLLPTEAEAQPVVPQQRRSRRIQKRQLSKAEENWRPCLSSVMSQTTGDDDAPETQFTVPQAPWATVSSAPPPLTKGSKQPPALSAKTWQWLRSVISGEYPYVSFADPSSGRDMALERLPRVTWPSTEARMLTPYDETNGADGIYFPSGLQQMPLDQFVELLESRSPGITALLQLSVRQPPPEGESENEDAGDDCDSEAAYNADTDPGEAED